MNKFYPSGKTRHCQKCRRHCRNYSNCRIKNEIDSENYFCKSKIAAKWKLILNANLSQQKKRSLCIRIEIKPTKLIITNYRL